MKRYQIYSILACVFYVIGLFQLAEKEFSAYSIICLGLGTIFMSLYVKSKKEGNNGSN